MKQTFYMVFLSGESTPTFRHETIESADIEAQRLARLHRKKAFVLCSLKSFEISEFKVEDCRPFTDDLPF